MSLLKKFTPTNGEAKYLQLKEFYWLYAEGSEIIAEYGNIFRQTIVPNRHYVIYSKTEVLKKNTLVVVSDKWDLAQFESGMEKDSRVKPECLGDDAWGIVKGNYSYNRQPVNVNGVECVLLFPVEKSGIPFLFSRKTGNMFPMLKLSLSSNPKLSRSFERMDAELGDWARFYSKGVKPITWNTLNIIPCNEFAHIGSLEYHVSDGYGLKINLSDRKFRDVSNKRKYLLIRRETKEGMKEIVFPSRWDLNGSNLEDECFANEDNSYLKMIGKQEYSGNRCLVNGKKCVIITFVPRVFNFIIWDTEDDKVFMLPSKPYPSDNYYKKLEAHFGPLYK